MNVEAAILLLRGIRYSGLKTDIRPHRKNENSRGMTHGCS